MTSRLMKRRLIAVAAAAVVAASGSATSFAAEVHGSVNQLGRLFGAGWGDGYHACESSGFRLGADLPPKSYSQRNRGPSRIKRAAQTFYDHFDAGRSYRPCDDVFCDSAPLIINGSQVIQQPKGWTPSQVTEDPGAPSVPTPAPRPVPAQPERIEIPSPVVPPAPELDQATKNVDQPPRSVSQPERRRGRLPKVTKKIETPPAVVATAKPVRPAAPVTAPRPEFELIEAVAAAARHRQLDVDRYGPDGTLISTTPHDIDPVHPGYDYASRTQRLLREALGDNFVMPKRAKRTRVATEPRTPSQAPAKRSASIESPSKPAAALVMPGLAVTQNPPSIKPESVKRRPESVKRPASAVVRIEEVVDRRPSYARQLPEFTVKREAGSSAAGSYAETPLAFDLPAPDEAIRIATSDAHRDANDRVSSGQSLPRPAVELAERPPRAGSPVIRQPH